MKKNTMALIKIEIPDDTLETIQKNKWLKSAIWAIADVVTWMQNDIEKWLDSTKEKKGK